MISWQTALISTPRGSFEVFIAGEGKPICVTHFYTSFTIRGNYFADLFTDFGKVILVNLKECGNSDGINQDSELSMAESIEDLEAIREYLGFEQWSFAGHSTGGMLGLVYAINHVDSLDQLIVVGAAASNEYMQSKDSIYCKRNPNNPRLREIFSILKSSESTDEQKAKAAREWTSMSLFHPERWDEYFNRPSSGSTVQKRLDYYNRNLFSFEIRNALHLITTDTLVMCGKYDAQCPLAYSEEIHHLIAGSKFHVFNDSNHSPHLEEYEQFLDVVKSFLVTGETDTE